MKSKKLSLPIIFILSGIVIAAILNVFICVAKKPAITEHSFPFSITYEFAGETVTIEDEFVCTYTGHDESSSPSERFYDGYCAKENDDIDCGEYLIKAYDNGNLVIITNHFAGYLMGDPQYDKHYNEYYLNEPYIAFYDCNEYTEHSDEEFLAPYDVRIVDWEYPERLENSFVFSKITRLTRHTVIPMAAISLLTLLVCLIFVKKDSGLKYGLTDKFSILLNFAIALIVLPFLTIVATFIDINGDASDPLSIATFFVPATIGFSLAASVSLRRKGFKKSGFVIQFVGIAFMALILGIEELSRFM